MGGSRLLMAFLTSPDPQLLTFKMFKVVSVDPSGKKKWAGTASSIAVQLGDQV